MEDDFIHPRRPLLWRFWVALPVMLVGSFLPLPAGERMTAWADRLVWGGPL